MLKDLLTPTELSSLSNDSKILYKAIEKSITTHVKNITDHYDAQIAIKDEQISNLAKKVDSLETTNSQLLDRVKRLEFDLDETAQYERRDTLILSGSMIPAEQTGEDPSQMVVDIIKDHLKVPFNIKDINVAHRLGRMRKESSFSRPIIVKLLSRSKKSQIVHARISQSKSNESSNAGNTPVLHINESLTPVRRTLFYKARQLRKKHPDLFKQLYTKDGKIMIKLTATGDRKYSIATQDDFSEFLKVSPVLEDTYNSL